jgi:hypothetical protein
MSLRVTSDRIIIENALGVAKFDSTQRLVFQRGYTTGSTTVSGSVFRAQVPHNLVFDPTTDFYSLFFRITACAGNGVTNLLNLRIPGNNQILVHQTGRNNGSVIYTDATLFSALVTRNSVVFNHFTRNAEIPHVRLSGFSVSLTYELFIYRYLQ